MSTEFGQKITKRLAAFTDALDKGNAITARFACHMTKEVVEMGLKDGGQDWTIKEQIVEDPVTGLTIQFEVMPDGDKRLRLFGPSLRFGNRELVFDENGKMSGSGTHLAGHCKPTWLDKIED